MSELVTKSVPQEQQEQRIEIRTAVKRIGGFTIVATAVATLAVLVATAASHRQAAFDSCHFLIDWLKTDAPFWKSEETPRGERWVGARSEDDEATQKWRKVE